MVIAMIGDQRDGNMGTSKGDSGDMHLRIAERIGRLARRIDPEEIRGVLRIALMAIMVPLDVAATLVGPGLASALVVLTLVVCVVFRPVPVGCVHFTARPCLRIATLHPNLDLNMGAATPSASVPGIPLHHLAQRQASRRRPALAAPSFTTGSSAHA
jgi:hypothetical protein